MTSDTQAIDIFNATLDILNDSRQALHSAPWETVTELNGFQIVYGTDENGDDFATLGMNLPDGIYAEIEGETFGALQGFRVYRLPETVADVEAKVTTLFPNATIEEDNDGQLVVYTGLTTDEDGTVILND